MSHTPPRIHTERADLDRIEERIRILHDEAHVRVTLDSGARIEGIVAVRPTVETFRDAAGDEGHNALLRLDDLAAPDVPHFIWVGDIETVERIDSA